MNQLADNTKQFLYGVDELFDNETFSLIETNPQYTGNIKIQVDENGEVSLSAFNGINSQLETIDYQNVKINEESTLVESLSFFAKSFPNDLLYKKSEISTNNEYVDTYIAGLRYNKHPIYKKSYLAPVWIGNKIPQYFVVYKLNGIVSNYSKSYTFEQLQQGIEYCVGYGYVTTSKGNYSSGDIFIAENASTMSSGLDSVFTKTDSFVNKKQELLKEGVLVASFSLKNDTKIGKLLSDLVSDKNRREWTLRWDLQNENRNNQFQTISGINFDNFSILDKKVNLQIPQNKELGIKETEKIINKSLSENNILSDKLLNLEFLFNTIDEFSIDRYYGFYTDVEYGIEITPSSEKTFSNRNKLGNTTSNIYTEEHFREEYEKSSVIQTNNEGVLLYLEGNDEIINEGNQKTVFTVLEDATNKLHSTIGHNTKADIRLTDKKFDYSKLSIITNNSEIELLKSEKALGGYSRIKILSPTNGEMLGFSIGDKKHNLYLTIGKYYASTESDITNNGITYTKNKIFKAQNTNYSLVGNSKVIEMDYVVILNPSTNISNGGYVGNFWTNSGTLTDSLISLSDCIENYVLRGFNVFREYDKITLISYHKTFDVYQSSNGFEINGKNFGLSENEVFYQTKDKLNILFGWKDKLDLVRCGEGQNKIIHNELETDYLLEPVMDTNTNTWSFSNEKKYTILGIKNAKKSIYQNFSLLKRSNFGILRIYNIRSFDNRIEFTQEGYDTSFSHSFYYMNKDNLIDGNTYKVYGDDNGIIEIWYNNTLWITLKKGDFFQWSDNFIIKQIYTETPLYFLPEWWENTEDYRKEGSIYNISSTYDLEIPKDSRELKYFNYKNHPKSIAYLDTLIPTQEISWGMYSNSFSDSRLFNPKFSLSSLIKNGYLVDTMESNNNPFDFTYEWFSIKQPNISVKLSNKDHTTTLNDNLISVFEKSNEVIQDYKTNYQKHYSIIKRNDNKLHTIFRGIEYFFYESYLEGYTFSVSLVVNNSNDFWDNSFYDNKNYPFKKQITVNKNQKSIDISIYMRLDDVRSYYGKNINLYKFFNSGDSYGTSYDNGIYSMYDSVYNSSSCTNELLYDLFDRYVFEGVNGTTISKNPMFLTDHFTLSDNIIYNNGIFEIPKIKRYGYSNEDNITSYKDLLILDKSNDLAYLIKPLEIKPDKILAKQGDIYIVKNFNSTPLLQNISLPFASNSYWENKPNFPKNEYANDLQALISNLTPKIFFSDMNGYDVIENGITTHIDKPILSTNSLKTITTDDRKINKNGKIIRENLKEKVKRLESVFLNPLTYGIMEGDLYSGNMDGNYFINIIAIGKNTSQFPNPIESPSIHNLSITDNHYQLVDKLNMNGKYCSYFGLYDYPKSLIEKAKEFVFGNLSFCFNQKKELVLKPSSILVITENDKKTITWDYRKDFTLLIRDKIETVLYFYKNEEHSTTKEEIINNVIDVLWSRYNVKLLQVKTKQNVADELLLKPLNSLSNFEKSLYSINKGFSSKFDYSQVNIINSKLKGNYSYDISLYLELK